MIPPCRHCMRGEPQNVDISDADIDAVLAQTDKILLLRFGGGEPLMALDRMQYTLDRIQARNIPLLGLYLVTNAIAVTDTALKLIKDYRVYIDACRAVYEAANGPLYYEPVFVHVSQDRYHREHDDGRGFRGYVKLIDGLYRYARVAKIEGGNTPAAIGLAKQLPAAETQARNPIPQHMVSMAEIAVCDADHIPACPVNKKLHDMLDPGEQIVCCDVVLTARGNIVNQYVADDEYVTEDVPGNIICRASDDIWCSILKYNVGKMSCADYNSFIAKLGRTGPQTTHHNPINAILNLVEKMKG